MSERWSSYPGDKLLKSVTLEIGDEQKITYEPCKKCNKPTVVKDIAKGYPTLIMDNLCLACRFEFLKPETTSTKKS